MTKKIPLSHVEISKENLIHNFKSLKSIAKKGTKFSVAIKGNAYGHGQNEIVKILNPHVDYFQVDSIEELKLLRKISNKQTFVFGYIEKDEIPNAIKLRCILSVFSIEQLKEIEKFAKENKMKQEIHLPIDALLGREGFLVEELNGFLKELKNYRNIKLTGAYAHFANIEDTNDFSHAKKQIKRYKEALNILKKFGYKNLQTHISATSGLLVYEKNEGMNSIVRLGIGVYGMWPSEDIQSSYKGEIDLKPVLSWKTKIAQIKTLTAGSIIGYGLTYVTNKPTKIAVIPQGYADGVDRGLSNKGEVLIAGTRCKILGRVAMNMFVVDVNYLPDVCIEDEVVLLGSQGKENITAEEIANKIDTINYEITTRLSSLLSRIVV